MIKAIKINFGYWLFLLFIQYSYGLVDSQAWTSIAIESKIPYSLKVEFEQELRLKSQLSEFHKSFSELAISYKVLDGLNIKIPYRYTLYNDKIKQRLSIGISYKYNLNLISLKYRTRYQKSYEEDKYPEKLIRNKFTIGYKLGDKLEPYLSGELFHLYKTYFGQLNEYRILIGLAFDLPKKNSIKVFYMYKKKDLNRSNPDVSNVFGLGYKIKL